MYTDVYLPMAWTYFVKRVGTWKIAKVPFNSSGPHIHLKFLIEKQRFSTVRIGPFALAIDIVYPDGQSTQ